MFIQLFLFLLINATLSRNPGVWIQQKEHTRQAMSQMSSLSGFRGFVVWASKNKVNSNPDNSLVLRYKYKKINHTTAYAFLDINVNATMVCKALILNFQLVFYPTCNKLQYEKKCETKFVLLAVRHFRRRPRLFHVVFCSAKVSKSDIQRVIKSERKGIFQFCKKFS